MSAYGTWRFGEDLRARRLTAKVFLAVLLPVLRLGAQDTRTITEPFFPPICSSLDAKLRSGAVGLSPESETSFDTQDVQKALDTCAHGQAVQLRARNHNNAFLIAPIRIPTGVTLLVSPAVTVFASRNPRDYDANADKTCGTLQKNSGGCVPLISVSHGDGSGVMGYGVIDGRGHLPMLIDGVASKISWWQLARQASGNLTQNNPRLLQVHNTDGFTLYKITLKNSPNFHVSLGTCTNATIWGVKIVTPYDARNTDGIDPGYSSNVTIRDSFISVGDDNVAIGGNNPPGASNISVVNNWFGNGHGASIGSYTQAGVSRVLFENIVISGEVLDRNQAGIRIKSDVSRGGLVENITYRNFCMKDVHAAIVLDPFYTAGAKGELIPQYRNISLQNIHATTEGTIKIFGYDATRPATVSLDNVQVDGVKASDVSIQYTGLTVGPTPINFSTMLTGQGVTVTDIVSQPNSTYTCSAEIFAPITGELIRGAPQRLSVGHVRVQLFTTKANSYASYQAQTDVDPSATLDLPAPTGTVTIYDGDNMLGSVPLTGARVMRVPLSSLAIGTHNLTAAYSGDDRYPAIKFGSYPVEILAPSAQTAPAKGHRW